jgi:hypothetical protein
VVVAKYEPVTKTWTVDENAVASIPETPTPVIEIPFDKSNPETIEADGKEYQGYYMSDGYGTRLVDEVNNIILVKDGDTWREPKSEITTEDYPVKFCETKTGKSDGFEIPITLCLGENANEGYDFYFSEVHMTEKGANDTASTFLRSSWGRYRRIMGHPDIEYDEYLNLLKEGKGNLEILNTTTRKPVLIDPRQGLSLVITGDKEYEMPIRAYDDFGFNYGSDEKGKLLWASNAAFHWNESENPLMTRNATARYMLTVIAGIVWISVIDDKCMYNQDIIKSCREITFPEDFNSQFKDIMEDYSLYNSGDSDDPLFTLR